MSLVELSFLNVLLHSSIHVSTVDLIDLLYREFTFSVSDLNARMWLSSQSIVCDRFKIFQSWRNCSHPYDPGLFLSQVRIQLKN